MARDEIHSRSGIERTALRSPDNVMNLARMGSAFPSRMSFMRILVRRLTADKSEVTRPVWEIDSHGFGRAVYSLQLGGNTYSLVAFSTALAPENRTDRVIAEAWDASFALFDGVPSKNDLDRLENCIPKQEAGRFEASELVISRANKSVRFFEHVVEQLSNGLQPDPKLAGAVGYLMRTTAVYGNGKFGFADRICIANRPEMNCPFQAEMLTVWLIRGFSHDLVEHIAQQRNPKKYQPLAKVSKKNLGIGNSTGLGMAPFLIKHSVLLNNWAKAKETALARVRAVERASIDTIKFALRLISRARQHVEEWAVADERQMERIGQLRRELKMVEDLVTENWLAQDYPWNCLIEKSSQWSLECQELIVSLVLEPHGHLIDDMCEQLSDTKGMQFDPAMAAGDLKKILDTNYSWALNVDFEEPKAVQFFWYTSEEKLEPRLGLRHEEAGAKLELPLDIARQAKILGDDLIAVNANQSVALFLANHPQHRHIVRRVQTSQLHPYCEIRNNLIGEDCLPLDILRYKLSFFGAAKCDPKSGLWTRINMYQGGPLFEDIKSGDTDDWWLPVLKEAE